MENVVLTVHLLLALVLIGVVLLQRSEGGGLGIGGGGGVVTGRSAATALGKITWGLAVAFICTSITLTVIAARNSSSTSVVDLVAPGTAEETPAGDVPLTPPSLDGGSLLPPSDSDSPLTPPRAE